MYNRSVGKMIRRGLVFCSSTQYSLKIYALNAHTYETCVDNSFVICFSVSNIHLSQFNIMQGETMSYNRMLGHRYTKMVLSSNNWHCVAEAPVDNLGMFLLQALDDPV